MQARGLITDLCPGDPVGRVQLRLVTELIEELEAIDRKIEAADKELCHVGHAARTVSQLVS